MSTKFPSVSPASGQKEKRKAINLETMPKIIAQLQADLSVLSTLKVGEAKL